MSSADEHHRLLLQHHPHAVAQVGPDGTVAEANPAAAALVGHAGEDLAGRHLYDLVELVDVESGVEAMQAALAGSTQQLDLTIRRRDAATVDLRVTVIPVPEDGQVTGALVVAEDVTEQRRLVHELAETRAVAAEAAAARTDLVARTNHEIRTPLTSILAVTELMVGATDPTEQRQLADTLRRSSRRLLRLIDNLLEFGAGDDAVDELIYEEFDLHDLIRDAVALVEVSARHRGLEVSVHLEDDVPRLVRDHPTWTSQILGNLLSNAVAHTETGSIELAVTRVQSTAAGACVMYRITDTGIGIPPEQADLVFEPFERPPREGHRSTAGVGLGLSIVKQLVSLSGGTVGFVSSPGVGSTFTVVLPVRPPAS